MKTAWINCAELSPSDLTAVSYVGNNKFLEDILDLISVIEALHGSSEDNFYMEALKTANRVKREVTKRQFNKIPLEQQDIDDLRAVLTKAVNVFYDKERPTSKKYIPLDPEESNMVALALGMSLGILSRVAKELGFKSSQKKP